MNDPTDLAAQESAEAQQATEADRKRKQERDDITWLMAHAPGRRFVARVFERTGIRRTPFNTNGSTMAFNAGAQNVGLWLEAEVLEHTPEAYFKMLKEFSR